MRYKVVLPTGLLVASLLFSGCGQKEDTAADAKPIPPAAADNAGTAPASAPDFSAATKQYRSFAIEQCDLFVKETEKFTNAVKAGKLEEAKQLYAPARAYYERIEPVAESLGNLDPNIDARINDVDAAEWRGFHRIEKALWEDKTTAGQEGYADQLLKDAQLLRAKIETIDLDASLMVTGAVELLNEVSSSKVTGEEELYSHTDLYDFAANVEGAEKIFEILRPELAKKDAGLEKEIGERFAALKQELGAFKKGDGYVDYTELNQDQIRKLSQNLDALAEPLSNMGKILGV
ncbi:EfeM/EfeO family lipoprotein [Paenibacillus donghaensis]|uniref:iron uptake system protein EfeO n=1 Tax=Paenibacillus donghaensis TaxID=414771 RepID=UPI00188409D1|nr:iron uptake system protein EfeO [Paenibacillus donghaensis]MBE9916031.1 EfeM/EfeO family lipoprotein [Paenibacillus donghaensis]